MSYKVEIKQLEAKNSSTKDLFSNLLNETKGFKYQINKSYLVHAKSYVKNIQIKWRN